MKFHLSTSLSMATGLVFLSSLSLASPLADEPASIAELKTSTEKVHRFEYLRGVSIISVLNHYEWMENGEQMSFTDENPVFTTSSDLALIRIVNQKYHAPKNGPLMLPSAKLKSGDYGYVELEAEVIHPYFGKVEKGHRFTMKLDITVTDYTNDGSFVRDGRRNTLHLPLYATGSEHVLNIRNHYDGDWWIDFGAFRLDREKVEAMVKQIYEIFPEAKPEGVGEFPEVKPKVTRMRLPRGLDFDYTTIKHTGDPLYGERCNLMAKQFPKFDYGIRFFIKDYEIDYTESKEFAGAVVLKNFRSAKLGDCVRVIVPLDVSVQDSGYTRASFFIPDAETIGRADNQCTLYHHESVVFFNREHLTIEDNPDSPGKKYYTIDARNGAFYAFGSDYMEAYDRIRSDNFDLLKDKSKLPLD